METKKKTKLPIVTLLLVTLLILIGTSYAYFDYTFIGKDNTITQSDISIKLLESNKEIISLENQLPMSDEQGMKQTNTGNVFDFSVETKSASDIKLGYKINIEKLKVDEGYTNLTDDQIKIYLTDTNDNKILGPLKISDLENYNLYEDINIHSKTNNTQVDKYRIRVWIDQDVQVKNWDENTKQQYKFKIGVGSTENEGSYIITYNSNGGTGTMGPSTYKENTQETLRKNTFTRGGYTFKGWSTTTTGEATYKDQNIATSLTTDQNEKNKTLYAIWQPNTYTVTYNPNGGSLSLGFTSTTTDYKWVENNGVYKSGNYNISNSTSTMKSENFTLTETQTISFDWAVSSESASYDYLYYTIYKDGTALSGTGTSTKIGGYTSSDTEDNLTYKTVTKTLETGTYTIEFSYRKDGSGNYGLDRGYVKNLIVPGYGEGKVMENSSFTVGQNNKLKQNQYKKSHYTFKGWSTKENSTNPKYQDENDLTDLETKVKEKENINLYAIWDINKYTVNVVVQNGTADTSSKQVEYKKEGTFNLTPTESDAVGTVTCTNNQNGIINNNILTINNVTNDTTCTVKFVDSVTTLYTDGTLIINEALGNRDSNIEKHGVVTNEYEAMSESNSYVMTIKTQLWKNERNSIESVEIGRKITPISTSHWFNSLSKMKKGDFTNLDTSKVTDMSYMFNSVGDKATTFELKELENWNTSKVTNMESMFNFVGEEATTWNIGDLSNWDTSNVTDMSYMFSSAGFKAETINLNLSGWNTSKVTNMTYMFASAGKNATTWNIGDLSNWDTSNVIDMSYMFYSAGFKAETINLNLSGWNTSKVTNMSAMFDSAGKNSATWSIGDLSNWDISNVIDISYMFDNAGYSATTWNIGDLSNWDVSKATDMRYMFSSAGYSTTTFNLKGLENWDTSSVTDMKYMFYYAGYNATTWNIGDLSNWDTSNVTDMSYMFYRTGKKATTWNIGDLSKWNTSSVTNMRYMFNYAGYSSTTFELKGLENWDTSSVTDMSYMFNSVGEEATTFSLNLSNWDVSKVTNMYYMFGLAGYNSTTFNLDLSKWNTSKVTDMGYMFISAGQKATTWSITIPKTTGTLTNTTDKFYGSSESVYADPSNRAFTLAS